MPNLKIPAGILLITAGLPGAGIAVIELRPAVSARMELTVEKTGLLAGKSHVFTFSQYEGTLRFDRETPAGSSVEFVIEAGTILCRDTWLSAKDLRKVQQYALHDMLAAENYPQIRFHSTRVTQRDAGHYDIEGILMIRDVAAPVRIDSSLTTGPGNEAVIEGSARVRLTDFGLKPAFCGARDHRHEERDDASFQFAGNLLHPSRR